MDQIGWVYKARDDVTPFAPLSFSMSSGLCMPICSSDDFYSDKSVIKAWIVVEGLLEAHSSASPAVTSTLSF